MNGSYNHLNLSYLMKTTSLIAVFLFVFQLGFGQSEKRLHGKVINNGFPIGGIDVINPSNSALTVTDASGRFSIMAKVGDVLIFAGKNYTTTRISLKQKDFDKSGIETALDKEVIQLVEVEISKEVDDVKLDTPTVAPLRSVDNILNSATNVMVYNGSITHGLNFVAIGKMIGKLFKGKDDKTLANVDTKDYVADNFNKDFFLNTLKLKEEEIGIFLEFCYADPKATTIANNNNILEVTDFLISKNEAFRKVKE